MSAVEPRGGASLTAAPDRDGSASGAREMTYLEAISDALREEMRRDETVFCLGEDIGAFGGAFKVTDGFVEEFGADRCLDMPLAENAIIGTAVGAAVEGMRPVCEMQFSDFISCGFDQLVNVAAKLHYRQGIAVPMVVRLPSGGGFSGGPFHSQNHEALFIQGSGEEMTVIAYGSSVHLALRVADELDEDIEVLDLRTLAPLDRESILLSVRKTGKALVAHEATRSCGVGAEVAALITEEAFEDLDAPVRRLTAPDVPIPFSPPLEQAVLPQLDDMKEACRALLAY